MIRSPAFDAKHELNFGWILKLENIAVVTKSDPKELVLGKAQGTVIKCLKYLIADTSQNSLYLVLVV